MSFFEEKAKLLLVTSGFSAKKIIKYIGNIFIFFGKKHDFCTVYLVGSAETGDAGPVLPHLSVPIGQVLVRVFASSIKHQNASVGLVIVRRVHRLELFLARSVPKVYQNFIAVVVGDTMSE